MTCRRKKVNILFRDFNIDPLYNEAYAGVDNALMVTEPTHFDVGLLDHKYLRKQLLMAKQPIIK